MQKSEKNNFLNINNVTALYGTMEKIAIKSALNICTWVKHV